MSMFDAYIGGNRKPRLRIRTYWPGPRFIRRKRFNKMRSGAARPMRRVGSKIPSVRTPNNQRPGVKVMRRVIPVAKAGPPAGAVVKRASQVKPMTAKALPAPRRLSAYGSGQVDPGDPYGLDELVYGMGTMRRRR